MLGRAVEAGTSSGAERIRSADANRSLTSTIAGGIGDYDRRQHLPRLIPLDAKELGDLYSIAPRSVLARLARALRAERNRGRAGHWTYDLNRHIALAQAYAAECRLNHRQMPPASIRRWTGSSSE